MAVQEIIKQLDTILEEYNADIYNSSMLEGFMVSQICVNNKVTGYELAKNVFGSRNSPITYVEEDFVSFIKSANTIWAYAIHKLEIKQFFERVKSSCQSDQSALFDWVDGFVIGYKLNIGKWNTVGSVKEVTLLAPISFLYRLHNLSTAYPHGNDIELYMDTSRHSMELSQMLPTLYESLKDPLINST